MSGKELIIIYQNTPLIYYHFLHYFNNLLTIYYDIYKKTK
jgi:hypothetical protein